MYCNPTQLFIFIRTYIIDIPILLDYDRKGLLSGQMPSVIPGYLALQAAAG